MSNFAHFGREVWLQVASVFIPGLLLVLESLVVVAPAIVGDLASLQLNAITTVLAGAVLISLFYATGLVCRAAGFSLVSRRDGWKRNGEDVLRNAEKLFSPEAVRATLEENPLISEKASDGNIKLRPGHFFYCKTWLRDKGLANTHDRQELEINVRAALIVPIGLLPTTAIRPISEAWDGGALIVGLSLVTLASLGLAVFLQHQTVLARRFESRDALMHFIIFQHIPPNQPPSG